MKVLITFAFFLIRILSISQERIADFYGSKINLNLNNLNCKGAVRENESLAGLNSTINLSIINYNLNDWALPCFLEKIVKDAFQDCSRKYKVEILSNLLSLQKINHAIGVVNKSTQIILISIDKSAKLINTPFFEVDGYRFISLSKSDQKYEKLRKIITFCKSKDIDIPLKYIVTPSIDTIPMAKKLLRFIDFNTSSYDSILVKMSFNHIDYFSDLPQLKPSGAVYKSPPSSPFEISLLNGLNPRLLQCRTLLDSINFLLRFVQTSIEYRDDQSIYNMSDFASFPENTVFLGKGDCEDKSQLFAYLIYRYFKNRVDIIFFIYENHVQVGLHSKDLKYENSTFIEFEGIKYLVAEPSVDSGSILGDVSLKDAYRRQIEFLK